jgi:hypothetical protein
MSQPSLILQYSCLVLSCLVSLETGTSLWHNRGAHGLIAPPWSCLALSWRKLGCPWLVQGQGQGFEAPPDPPEPKRCSPRVSPISSLSLSLQTPRPRGVTIKTSPFPVSRFGRPLFSSQLSSHLFYIIPFLFSAAFTGPFPYLLPINHSHSTNYTAYKWPLIFHSDAS